MFRPNTHCLLFVRSDTQDLYGSYTFDDPITVPCTVVAMDLKVTKTSVRADSSASRGRAEEEIGTARILFKADATIKEGDQVQMDGNTLDCTRIFQRHDVLGKIDHLQVDFRKGAVPA